MNIVKHLETAALPAPWPPADLSLPDTIEAIERGTPARQRTLFAPDDSRAERLARLVGDANTIGFNLCRSTQP